MSQISTPTIKIKHSISRNFLDFSKDQEKRINSINLYFNELKAQMLKQLTTIELSNIETISINTKIKLESK